MQKEGRVQFEILISSDDGFSVIAETRRTSKGQIWPSADFSIIHSSDKEYETLKSNEFVVKQSICFPFSSLQFVSWALMVKLFFHLVCFLLNFNEILFKKDLMKIDVNWLGSIDSIFVLLQSTEVRLTRLFYVTIDNITGCTKLVSLRHILLS